jgi:hypothetical protein
LRRVGQPLGLVRSAGACTETEPVTQRIVTWSTHSETAALRKHS